MNRPRLTLAAATAALSLFVLGACGSSAQDQAQSLAAALSAEAAAGQASAEQALSSAEQALSSAQESLQEDTAATSDAESTTRSSRAEATAEDSTAEDSTAEDSTTEGSATDEPTGSDDLDATTDADSTDDSSLDLDAEASIDEMAVLSPECQNTLNGFLSISPLLLGPITGGSVSQEEIDEAFAAADEVLPADLQDEAAVIRQAAEDSIGVDMNTAADIVNDPKVTAAMDALSDAVDQRCGG